jgi:MFS family permease
MGMMFAISSVAGPLVGGLFTDHVSWRWCFYVNMPIGILAFVMIWWTFRNFDIRITDKIQIDFTGTVLIIAVVIALELAISWGGEKYEWSDPMIILLLVTGVVLIIPFATSQRDAPLPIIPLRLFTVRNIILPSMASFILGWVMFTCFIFLPVWFQVWSFSFSFSFRNSCLSLSLGRNG